MRMFKLIVTALILIIIALFIYQNVATFESSVPFKFNMYVTQQSEWTHSLYTVILISGGIGFLVGIVLMLKPYFSVRRKLAQERQAKQQAVSLPQAEQPTAAAKETSEQS